MMSPMQICSVMNTLAPSMKSAMTATATTIAMAMTAAPKAMMPCLGRREM